jgi:hypothetical protein
MSSALGTFLGLVSDIASIGQTKTNEEQHRRRYQMEKSDEEYARREYDHQQRINNLNNEKYFWQNIALRKTTLYPKQSVSGKVLFYHQPKAKYLLLKFSIASSNIKMWFKQEVKKVS